MKILVTMGSPILNEKLDILQEYKEDVIVLRPYGCKEKTAYREVSLPEGIKVVGIHKSQKAVKDALFELMDEQENVVLLADLSDLSKLPVYIFCSYANHFCLHLVTIKPEFYATDSAYTSFLKDTFYAFRTIYAFHEEDYIDAVYRLLYNAPYTPENALRKDLPREYWEDVYNCATRDINKRVALLLENLKSAPINRKYIINDYSVYRNILEPYQDSEGQEVLNVLNYIETLAKLEWKELGGLSEEERYALNNYGEYIANIDCLRRLALYWDKTYRERNGMVHEEVKKSLLCKLRSIQKEWMPGKNEGSALDWLADYLEQHQGILPLEASLGAPTIETPKSRVGSGNSKAKMEMRREEIQKEAVLSPVHGKEYPKKEKQGWFHRK